MPRRDSGAAGSDGAAAPGGRAWCPPPGPRCWARRIPSHATGPSVTRRATMTTTMIARRDQESPTTLTTIDARGRRSTATRCRHGPPSGRRSCRDAKRYQRADAGAAQYYEVSADHELAPGQHVQVTDSLIPTSGAPQKVIPYSAVIYDTQRQHLDLHQSRAAGLRPPAHRRRTTSRAIALS